MKNFILFLVIFIFSLFFTACSTKEVFEPKIVVAEWEHHGDAKERLVDTTSNAALLESGKVLLKSSTVNIDIAPDNRLISSSDGWILSATIDGNLTLTSIDDTTTKEVFNLKKTIASASVKDDILAVLFADNELGLYYISTKETILKEQGEAAIIADARIVNPYFMNGLVIFSTLDGKIVIINEKLKKKLRTVIVSSEDHFNNIIYFNVIDSKLIAATAYKMLSMSKKEVRAKYEIRNIAYDEKDIFITTKQGELISMTPDLQVNAKLKFPFAHFLGMIVTDDNVYILEKEGYIIEVSKDLLTYSVYEVDVNEGFVFVSEDRFYVDDNYISVKDPSKTQNNE